MKIDDIITLGKMGFTAEQVKQMMQLESPAQPQVQTPAAAPAAPAAAPAVPDPMTTLTQQVQNLTALVQGKINTPPQAGVLGEVKPVTSVEDIILGLVQPAAAPESPDFTKGVNING